ncbi:MAG: ABC transporter ATP-binding protein [Phycisphaerae bacterium]
MAKHAKSRMLWQAMAGQRLRYAAAMVAMIIASVVMLGQPLVTSQVIDYVITGKPLQAPQFVRRWVDSAGGRDALAANLWIAAVAMFGVMAVSGLFTYLRGRWSALASESICRNLRNRLYDHLQHLPARYHDQADTGDLVQRASSDVETLRLFLSQQVVEIGRALVLVLAIVPVMFLLSTSMALWSLTLIIPIAAFASVFFIRARHSFQEMDEAEGAMTTTVQENLTGIRVVRAFARGEFEKQKFAATNDAYRDKWYRLMVIMAWFWSLSDLLCLTQMGIVLVAGVWHILAGALSYGEFIAFWMLVNQFLWPIRHMGRVLSELGKASVALGRIQEVLDAPAEPHEADAAVKDRHAEGRIRFAHVTFSHGEDAHVLRDVSFEVAPGKTLALLGASGSGKSTIVNLLLRLYDYENGTIELDGEEIRCLPRKYVRSQIGVVMQEPFLYSRSIRENIKLGRSRAEDAEMFAAAEAACISQSIQQFDDGYETEVGERGVTLSGGQRQRVCIARALLKDPPVLVLDDALSAVDTRTESMILHALAQRKGRHTTIVIAHRLSTLMQADEILVLDHGRIIQRGRHADLVDQPGLYQRLWEIQSSLAEDLRNEMTPAPAAEAE